MTRNKFDIEYLEWLQRLDVKEDNSVWEEIQNELDFVETWGYLDRELARIKPKRRIVDTMLYLRIGIAAAAVILIIFASIFLLNEKTIHPPIPSEQKLTNETLVEKEGKTTSEVTKEVDIRAILQNSSPGLTSATGSNHRKSVNLTENESALPEKKEDQDSPEQAGESRMERIQVKQFEAEKLSVININDLSSNDLSSLIVPKNLSLPGLSKTSGSFFHIVDIGLVYGYKNTWLLNYETINGLNPRKLGNSIPTFHQEMGISSTLSLKDHHLIGIEFFWRSETGQKYQQYINANYVDRNITLDYLKLQAYYIWDHKKIPGKTIIGGYIAELNLAHEIQGKVMFSVGKNYRKLDYGLLIGHQFNIPVIDRLIIRPGFRINYNFINIFKGDAIIPGRFKYTSNFAAGLDIAISYRFLH